MKTLFSSLLLSSLALAASAETIGSVSTTFKLLSPNDKVVGKRSTNPRLVALI